MKTKKIAIIGAGITGLSAAHRLEKKGHEVHLFERRAESGGSIKTVKQDDWLVEYGPNTLLVKDVLVIDLIKDLGLQSEMLIANPEASKRFIVKNGTLEPLPAGFLSAVKTPLFSLSAKLKLLAEPFRPNGTDTDETVASFVERRLGPEFLDYGINPFVAGIFAGSPDKLSLRHAFPMMKEMEEEHGSLIKAAVKKMTGKKDPKKVKRQLVSFRKGIQQLPEVIAASLSHLHMSHEVHHILKDGDKWQLVVNDLPFTGFDEVLVNIPLYKIPDNLIPQSETEIEKLREVYYPPLSVIVLGFKKEQITHPMDGFGFLVPEKEERRILGSLFSSTLFPDRVPERHVLITTFVGGSRQPELASLDSEVLIEMVQEELTELIGLKGEAVFKDHIFWPKSIPQYTVGYDRYLQEMEKITEKNPGIHLIGNFREGISVPDCIKNGIICAEMIG
jgi:oxygen-dependent protoporphyrinogen oxidase